MKRGIEQLGAEHYEGWVRAGVLLVGAALTQRPELFGATLPAVGVLDMLRYHLPSANARNWQTDYGLSENGERFTESELGRAVTLDPRRAHHPDRRALQRLPVERDQREVRLDTESFEAGLYSAFRQDMDVILVGEMRGHEAIGAAVSAAETGHLVFSTLHTNNAAQTIDLA